MKTSSHGLSIMAALRMSGIVILLNGCITGPGGGMDSPLPEAVLLTRSVERMQYSDTVLVSKKLMPVSVISDTRDFLKFPYLPDDQIYYVQKEDTGQRTPLVRSCQLTILPTLAVREVNPIYVRLILKNEGGGKLRLLVPRTALTGVESNSRDSTGTTSCTDLPPEIVGVLENRASLRIMTNPSFYTKQDELRSLRGAQQYLLKWTEAFSKSYSHVAFSDKLVEQDIGEDMQDVLFVFSDSGAKGYSFSIFLAAEDGGIFGYRFKFVVVPYRAYRHKLESIEYHGSGIAPLE